ncbi:MAG: hypothetical protein WA964_18690 [Ilumatobacter sp.]|uniref:hypothetical protein n=1 Tax=Ilumatobacter sp. TaxID=1967498 RepID=UPI003C72562E
MRKILLATPFVALALVSCSATANYKSQTEDFIESDEVETADGINAEVSDAVCEEPTNTDIGTTYECVATVEGRGELTFVATIIAENEYSVTLPES